MENIGIIIVNLFCGSIMFSYLIGKTLLKKDIREVGDGNPGASNVIKACGVKYGVIAIILDYSKGFIPVLIAFHILNLKGIYLILAAIAPVIGHAFSPFLKFKGGKAIAVTFGIWSGLTLWRVPSLLGIVLVILSTLVKVKEDGWKVVFAMLIVLVYIFICIYSFELLVIWVINFIIILYKHKDDLKKTIYILLHK